MINVTVTPTDNGPSLVERPVRILDAGGTAYDLSEQAAIFLCHYGGSGTKPFCDGTHLTRHFEAADRVGLSAGASEPG